MVLRLFFSILKMCFFHSHFENGIFSSNFFPNFLFYSLSKQKKIEKIFSFGSRIAFSSFSFLNSEDTHNIHTLGLNSFLCTHCDNRGRKRGWRTSNIHKGSINVYTENNRHWHDGENVNCVA